MAAPSDRCPYSKIVVEARRAAQVHWGISIHADGMVGMMGMVWPLKQLGDPGIASNIVVRSTTVVERGSHETQYFSQDVDRRNRSR
jgi:hypothetical protein